MERLAALLVCGLPLTAAAAPLPLYDTSRDQPVVAPLAPPLPCGGFAVACSTPPGATPVPPKLALPFEYGFTVSGTVGGSTRGHGFSGEGVSGWVKAKDLPVSVYFDLERFQPFGR